MAVRLQIWHHGFMNAFLALAIVHLLGVASPGPDFAFITKQSLTQDRRTAVFGAAGLGAAVLLHCAYCIFGLGVVISQSVIAFNALKYIGAAYLMYIGFRALTHKTDANRKARKACSVSKIEPRKAFSMGFLCNALNPKATVFFLAIFTQFIDPNTALHVQVAYGLYMGVATFVWFSFLASVFTLSAVRRFFSKFQSAVERFMGAVLIAMGLKVALTGRE